MKLKFIQTSIACPEQYDVFNEKYEQVGYLRLRHGWFRVDIPNCGVKTIYEAYPTGADGEFRSDKQREYYIGKAERLIINSL